MTYNIVQALSQSERDQCRQIRKTGSFAHNSKLRAVNELNGLKAVFIDEQGYDAAIESSP